MVHASNSEQTLERRVANQERMVDVMVTHHEHLAQQIGEMVVGIRDLTTRHQQQAAALMNMERRIPELMAQGIVSAVGNPATWQAGRDAMKRHARDAAGGWILGSLRFLVDKVIWAGVALAAVYIIGGWSAVAALLKIGDRP